MAQTELRWTRKHLLSIEALLCLRLRGMRLQRQGLRRGKHLEQERQPRTEPAHARHPQVLLGSQGDHLTQGVTAIREPGGSRRVRAHPELCLRRGRGRCAAQLRNGGARAPRVALNGILEAMHLARVYLLTWSGETMRAAALLILSLILPCGCKTVPDSLDSVASATVPSSAPPPDRKLDVLASCRATGSPKGVTWQCPNDVVALDMQSDKHDDAAEVAQNLDRFAEPFVGMGIAKDSGELTAGSLRLRSVKLAGEKPGAGPVVARMAVVDATPTRYVSCAAKRDACDDVLRALVARTPGAKAGNP